MQLIVTWLLVGAGAQDTLPSQQSVTRRLAGSIDSLPARECIRENKPPMEVRLTIYGFWLTHDALRRSMARPMAPESQSTVFGSADH
jgi:hypothetical protein